MILTAAILSLSPPMTLLASRYADSNVVHVRELYISRHVVEGTGVSILLPEKSLPVGNPVAHKDRLAIAATSEGGERTTIFVWNRQRQELLAIRKTRQLIDMQWSWDGTLALLVQDKTETVLDLWRPAEKLCRVGGINYSAVGWEGTTLILSKGSSVLEFDNSKVKLVGHAKSRVISLSTDGSKLFLAEDGLYKLAEGGLAHFWGNAPMNAAYPSLLYESTGRKIALHWQVDIPNQGRGEGLHETAHSIRVLDVKGGGVLSELNWTDGPPPLIPSYLHTEWWLGPQAASCLDAS